MKNYEITSDCVGFGRNLKRGEIINASEIAAHPADFTILSAAGFIRETKKTAKKK